MKFYNVKFAALGVAVSLMALQPALAKSLQTLDVASTAALFPQYYPLAVGESHGLFKAEGLTISQLATGGGGATVQPVISGATPIGLASMSGAILAKLRNAPVKVICGVSPNFMSTIVFAVAADSPIKKLSDLSKKSEAKIGYTSGGSVTDVASSVAVKKEKLGSHVVRVAMGSMQAEAAALLTHQIQVATVNTNTLAKYVAKGKVRIIGDMGEYMPSLEANAIIANVPFIHKHKGEIERFLRAYSKSVSFSNQHRDAVEKLYSKDKKVSPKVAKLVFGKLTWTTKIKYAGFVTEVNILKGIGKVPKTTNAKQLYARLVDLSMLPKK